MREIRISALIVSLLVFASLFAGCGSSSGSGAAKESTSKESASSASAGQEGIYKDGTYKAKYNMNDVRDWRAFVEITIKGGKIAGARYGYTNDKSEIRSENKSYADGFKKANKVTPKEVFAEFGNRLVKAQDPAKIDVYTGATHSSKNFKELSASALENAKKGDAAEVIVPLYKDGIYKVEYDKFDSHGWKAQVELEVKDGKILNVKYDYINKDGKLKSQDADYKKNMEAVSKTYPEKYIKELQDQLVNKQLIARVDAITGATDSSKNFKALVEYALDEMAEKGDTSPKKIPLPKS